MFIHRRAALLSLKTHLSNFGKFGTFLSKKPMGTHPQPHRPLLFREDFPADFGNLAAGTFSRFLPQELQRGPTLLGSKGLCLDLALQTGPDGVALGPAED